MGGGGGEVGKAKKKKRRGRLGGNRTTFINNCKIVLLNGKGISSRGTYPTFLSNNKKKHTSQKV